MASARNQADVEGARGKVADLDAATRKIRKLKTEVVRNFYSLGGELKRVRDGKVYLARHRTFKAYLESEAELSESTAHRLIRIVERFTRAACEDLGFERLDAALRLMDATPADEDPQKVAEIRVPTGRTKGKRTPETKALAEATAAEIDAAARAEKAKRRDGKKADGRARPLAGDRFALTAEKDLRRAGHGHVDVKARKAPASLKAADGAGFLVDILGLGPGLATRALKALTKSE
jgi:hypothetical protein